MLCKSSSSVNSCPDDERWITQQHEYINSMKEKSTYCQYVLEDHMHAENLEDLVNQLLTELVNDRPHLDEKETTQTTSQKIKNIEYGYRNVTESISMSLNRWLDLRKNVITSLRGAEVKFRLIHRTTASITFVASTLEMVARTGLILRDLFDYDSSFPFKIIPLLGGISLTSSLVALSYSRTALEDVARDMRDEKRLHIDLETMYRKGNLIDDSVQKLFPYGIDLNLMNDAMRKQDIKSMDRRTWIHLLCSVIILTNFRKDSKIIDDEGFLQTLKAFVRSNAAQLWFSRIKMRSLLDEMAGKSKSLEKKEVSSGSEAFLSIAAINLYPVFFSLFFNHESFDKVRLISSTVTALLTAKKVAGKEKDEFQDLRQTCKALMKEYKKIKKMNKYLLNDYE